MSLAKSRERAITVVALSPPVPFRLFFVRWISPTFAVADIFQFFVMIFVLKSCVFIIGI